MNTCVSIYIPRMSIAWTENNVKEVIYVYGFRNVSYVDFTPVNKKPGFREDTDSGFKSAFIHFNEPYISAEEKYQWTSEESMSKEFWRKILNGESYKIQVTRQEYWICLTNKNPVKRTLMNIHQVVENGRHLENLISEQAEEIKNLKTTLHQLLGGLYCQRTQAGALSRHLQNIGYDRDGDIKNNTHQFDYWPTTRQGDVNSTRIENLENKLKSLEDYVARVENDLNR